MPLSFEVSAGLDAGCVDVVSDFLSLFDEEESAFSLSTLPVPCSLLFCGLVPPLVSGLGAGFLSPEPLSSDGVTIFPKQ